MIKEISEDSQEINLRHLMEDIKEVFDYTNCELNCNGDIIKLAYTYSDERYWWNTLTLIIRQPVVFLYDDDGNLLACGIPTDKNFESDFANTIYEIANNLD